MAAEQADLYPSERVLWTGAPDRVPVFEPSDRILIPFSLLSNGIAAAMLVSSVKAHSAGVALAWFIVVFGLFMLVGRLIVRRLALRSSWYTITDRRLVVTTRVLGRRRDYTAYLGNLQPPLLREHRDGIGTIRFGNSGLLDDLLVAGLKAVTNPLVLHGIPQARHVRDIIAAAQGSAAMG